MRILVTNDDGIGSPGLLALAAMAVRAGHDVVVAAPAKEASGSSAALIVVGVEGRVGIEDVTLPATCAASAGPTSPSSAWCR